MTRSGNNRDEHRDTWDLIVLSAGFWDSSIGYESHFSWRKLEERALSLRGERVELEREKILRGGFKGVWRGFHTVTTASSHRSTYKSRFILREVLGRRRLLWCQRTRFSAFTRRVKKESRFSVGFRRKQKESRFSASPDLASESSDQELDNERALSLRGERVELEREKILGGGFKGVWRGFHTVAPASSHRSTSKSRFVLREVLGRRRLLWCQRTRFSAFTRRVKKEFRFSIGFRRKQKKSRFSASPGLDAIGEHRGAGHDHNVVVPFGGRPPGSEGLDHNYLPAVPFGSKITY
ncbi:hypothetical protein M5K25_020871 [Dendrobium thyrsiflorum]|uniref:Uncharacterized protein n=1 Tax=Dendrobium thyrsiflorum TaxID=117978 RepID=A0ABD0UHX8_DENTH